MLTEQKEHTAHCANSIVLFFRSVGNTRVYGQTKASSDDYEHELTSKSMAGRAERKWLTRMKSNRRGKKSAMTMMTALTISDDKPIENVPH